MVTLFVLDFLEAQSEPPLSDFCLPPLFTEWPGHGSGGVEADGNGDRGGKDDASGGTKDDADGDGKVNANDGVWLRAPNDG